MKGFAGVILAVFVLAGCGGGLEKKVVGFWKVDTVKTQMGGDKVKTADDRKIMMGMLSTITIDIKADKTFDMKLLFPINGTWALNGNKLALTPKLKAGEKFGFGGKNTMDFDVDASGTSMSVVSTEADMPGTLVMSKNPS
ncbi:MAG: hypothetical protein IT203_00080 [Fimbriimonadaceae bacterium]|nr:hypothetical protein [Fimbriimonadaceae bacterium]